MYVRNIATVIRVSPQLSARILSAAKMLGHAVIREVFHAGPPTASTSSLPPTASTSSLPPTVSTSSLYTSHCLHLKSIYLPPSPPQVYIPPTVSTSSIPPTASTSSLPHIPPPQVYLTSPPPKVSPLSQTQHSPTLTRLTLV